MCQCRKYHRKQQKKQLETLEPDCVNHHSCNPWSSTLRLWTFDAVFFCKFSVGIRRRNDCSKMCLRFARHPFRHTFTQRCGLFSCLTSCFLRIVYFNWCIWGIWICTLNPWHEPGTKMFDVFCEYSCLVQTRFFFQNNPKKGKTTQNAFFAPRGLSARYLAWCNGRIKRKTFGKRDHVRQTQQSHVP